MRLVVTGTREGRADTWHWLDRWVARNGRPTLVILGDARGVDEQARQWCIRRGYLYRRKRASWYPYTDHRCCTMNRLAGFERNQDMVDHAGRGDHCVGLPSLRSKSAGTKDCMRRALRSNLRVFEVLLKPKEKWRAGE